MKVGIVGGEAALQMALRDSCRELILIDEDRRLAVSQALDIAQTSAVAGGPRVRARDYQDLVGAEIIVLVPGINEKAGGADRLGDQEGRLRLLDPNVPIFRDIVPKAIAAAPDAVLLVATSPHLSAEANSIHHECPTPAEAYARTFNTKSAGDIRLVAAVGTF